MANCVVYGAEFFSAFTAVLESLKQTIITVLNCEYDLSDIGKLVQLNLEINTEIERTGKTLMKLAQELDGKIHDCCNQPNCQKQTDDDCKDADVNTAAKDNAIATNCVPKDNIATVTQLETKLECANKIDDLDTAEIDGCVNILDIEEKLENERQRNNRLESELEQMRIIHEDRWAKMEDRVRQAEMKISKKQKQKIFERRKEMRQSLLREENLCSDIFSQKDYDKRCLESASTSGTTWVQAKKSERQLQEEIKWSRIMPVSVRGAKTRYQQGLEVQFKRK